MAPLRSLLYLAWLVSVRCSPGTLSPTISPSLAPSSEPTIFPTFVPTHTPTTSQPTPPTTSQPTGAPTPQIIPYRFGQSSALSGLSGDLGTNMKAGTLAAFQRINTAGGIHGRLLNLTWMDDGYEPGPAQTNTIQLVNLDVIACVSYTGTPTTANSTKITTPAHVPMIAPFTGARSLRIPTSRYVINTRASYDEEIYAWVTYCLSQGITLFSIFYQDDLFGQAGLSALQLALKNLNLNILSSGTYPRNSLNVSLDTLLSVGINPQAIVMIGTAQPLALFVSLAQVQWPSALFHSVSFLGSERFLDMLRFYSVSPAVAKRVFVTQVFPIPQPLSVLQAANVSKHSDLLLDFALAMNAYCGSCNLSFGALEGFVAGRLVAVVLTKMGPFDTSNLNFQMYWQQAGISAAQLSLNDKPSVAAWREYFLDTFYEEASFDILGLRLGPYVQNITCTPNYVDCFQPQAPACSQGMQNVFLTQPDVVNYTYNELFPWRVQSPFCNIRSQVVDPDFRPLVFGQTAVFTGSAQGLGINMRNGLLAAFKAANLSPAGGVRSRKLLLLPMDDYYDPIQAAVNARNLVSNQSLIAIVGATGTPTATATLPIFANASIPFIGPFTGARALRGQGVVNVRAQYDDECAAMVDYALGRGWTKISLLRQNDSYGAAGELGAQLALSFHKRQLYSIATVPRLSSNVQPAFDNFTNAGVPDAVILFTTSAPGAAFVTMAVNDPAWANVVFIAVSFVGLEAFQGLLSAPVLASGRVLFSAVVPPLSANSPISNSYLAALRLLDPTLSPTYGSLEGYVVGRLIIHLLSRATELTGAAMLAELYSAKEISIDELVLGPYTNSSSTTCNLGMRTTYLLRLDVNGTTLLNTWRTTPANPFIQDCGSFTLYDDAKFKCPDGYSKDYINGSNLDAVCTLCLNALGCTLPERIPNIPLRSAMLALNVIGSMVAVVLMLVVLRFRNTVTIKAVSPPFCLLMLCGSLIGYFFVYVLYPPEPTDAQCMAQVYLLNVAFCLMFGSLFAKVYRVTQIFKPRKQKSLRVVKIQDSVLYTGVGATLVVELIFTILWHALSPLKRVQLNNGEEKYWTCRSDQPIWGVANVIANGVFLFYGILLSVQSRRIPTVFNEAKYVAATLYNTMVVGSIAVLAGYLLANNDDELYMYKALGAFIIFTVAMALLIGSKFPSLWSEVVYKRAPTFRRDDSSSSGKETTPGDLASATLGSDKVLNTSKDKSVSPVASKDGPALKTVSAKRPSLELGRTLTVPDINKPRNSGELRVSFVDKDKPRNSTDLRQQSLALE